MQRLSHGALLVFSYYDLTKADLGELVKALDDLDRYDDLDDPDI